jgi:flagellar P-ring protein precursor FlgI
MNFRRGIILLLFLALGGVPSQAEVSVRIGDVSVVDGMRPNQVLGYGLVVGLQGTGDSKTVLAETALKNLLGNLGIRTDMIRARNCAAVMITAELPARAHNGDRVDVFVSSIGDAKSLTGGMLVQSPLRGADDAIYVVAQGSLSQPEGQGTRRPVKTVARITGGGLVERDVIPEVVRDNAVTLVIKQWNYGLAGAIIKAIESRYPEAKPALTEEGKVRFALVSAVSQAEMIGEIEKLEVPYDPAAVVVISEKDGTIVAGGSVTIAESMISRAGLVIEIENSAKKGSAFVMANTSSVADLVEALNATGASTADIIAIFKALKEAGSLQAELIVR